MQRLYLDNAATTKMTPCAIDEYLQCANEFYANASNVHIDSQRAQSKLEWARESVSDILGCRPDEIIFTGGATESDNLAIIGYAIKNSNKGKHIITSVAEHPAVLNSCKYLEQIGFEVTYLPVDEYCCTDIKLLKDAIRDDTILISIMSVNNETGIINPIDKIAEIALERNIPLHTDAVQAITKFDINVNKTGISILSASGHKFGSAKGVGFLYIKKGININALTKGGAQEEGLRPGTIDTPAIASLAVAAQYALKIAKKREEHMKEIKNIFVNGLCREEGISLNTGGNDTIYDIMNFSFLNTESDKLLYKLDNMGLSVSSGSACSAGSLEVSHVIRAMGKDKGLAAIRISPGMDIEASDAKRAVEIIFKAYNEVKEK